MNLTIYNSKGLIHRHYPQVNRIVVTSDATLKVYLMDEYNQVYIHDYSKEFYEWFEIGDK